MMAKLVMLLACFTAARTSVAEDACTVNVDDETSGSGHAMLQVSESAPHSRKVQSHAPGHKSKVSKKSTKLTKKSTKLTKKSTKLTKKSKKVKTPDASNVALSPSGYKTIADECCAYEMEEFIRRYAMSEDLKVCDEGGLQGIVPFHTCEAKQNFTILQKEVASSSSGACPWTAPKDGPCKKISKSCGQVADPMAHRRRNCGRADNSQELDLEMQNAATSEFLDSKCGTHQQYTDVESTAGVLQACKLTGDISKNRTAVLKCMNECCDTSSCIGISVKTEGTNLMKGFEDSFASEGALAYLHRQR